MKLKFDIDRPYNKDRFKDNSFEKRPKSEIGSLPTFNFLREYPISEETEKEILELTEKNLYPIYQLVNIQVNFESAGSRTSVVLGIDDDMLRVLNSYDDESGVLHEGVGYYELRYLFKQMVDTQKIRTLCLNKYNALGGEKGVENVIFNPDLTDKEWFISMLDAFQSYESPVGLTDKRLIDINNKILKWKAKFFTSDNKKRKFSEGLKLKEYNDGENTFEDETLAELVHDATIDIFGRYTYSKMMTGSLFVDESSLDNVYFLVTSYRSFRNSFKHNNRLFLEHYRSQEFGLPPQLLGDRGIGYLMDTIVFGPSRRLEVIKEIGDLPQESILRTPHIPTDNWNPSYITYRDAVQLGHDKLMTYTSMLSYWLSKIFAYKPIVYKSSYSGGVSSIEGTRMFLQEIYQKFVEKTKNYKGENKEFFMHLVEDQFYHLLILGTSRFIAQDRSNLKNFLIDPDNNMKYTIVLENLGIDIPDIFKSVDLNKGDIQYWKDRDVFDLYIKSLRIDTSSKNVPDLDTLNLLSDLKEPISQFGRSLKDLALRFAEDNKKLYIIPMKMFTHGLAQSTSISSKYDTSSLTDTIKASLTWRAWELDGSNLDNFHSRYSKVLRALIEGRFSLYFIAVDKNTGDFEHVGVLNILQGALSLGQVYFSSKTGYRTFNEIESFDSQFYSDFNTIMKLFKQQPLPFVPRSDKDITSLYEFLF